VNIAAAISLLATAVGLAFGVIWWRISRAPGWLSMRWLAAIAFTAAGYCAFDTLVVFDLPAGFIVWATQIAFTLSSLHAFAWIVWLAASQPRPLDGFDRTMLAVALFFAAAGLVPRFLVSDTVVSHQVPSLGVTYYAALPTSFGLVCYLFFLAAMWFVAWRSLARWKLGWRSRLPAIAVAILTLLAVNDTLATAQLTSMPILADFGFLIILTIFGVDSLGRFAEDAERLEELSHQLEHVVGERTRQLEVAHLELAKERTVAAVGRLAGGVAHQINSPATVISVNLGLMRDELAEQGGLTATMGELLDESREALHRILGIVTDLRTSSGAIETHSASHHAAALRTCVETAVERAAQRGARAARTNVNVPGELHAMGDRDILIHLLSELLTNAASAAVSAHAAGSRVDVVARETGAGVEVDITDNGLGVPTAVRAALFEPFAGAHGVAQGRGLGLSVVRGLADRLGATLQLVESSSHGTVFRVVLRALPAA
jgi:signal transduction histidine kinase